MRPYRSENAERWIAFDHRPDDIVVSTRSKCGTTWMQMICCLLVHQTTPLPGPLGELSPWLDWRVEPLDVDQARMAELKGEAPREAPTMAIDEWLDRWIDGRADPLESLDTLAGNLHHLSDAWGRRASGNVVLVHYEELQDDLAGQMRGLARRLGIEVPAARWPELVQAATFDAMRERPSESSPDHLGVFTDPRAFFRSGGVGDGVAACSADQLERYRRRAAELAAPEVLAWLHRGDPARG